MSLFCITHIGCSICDLSFLALVFLACLPAFLCEFLFFGGVTNPGPHPVSQRTTLYFGLGAPLSQSCLLGWTIGPHWGWGKLNVPGLADVPPLGQPLLWHLWDLWVLASWTADPVLCPQWQEGSHREFTRKVHNHKALPSKVPHIFHSGRPRAPSVRPAYLLLRPAYLRSPQGFMCVFSDPSAPILFLSYLLDGVWEKRDSSSC